MVMYLCMYIHESCQLSLFSEAGFLEEDIKDLRNVRETRKTADKKHGEMSAPYSKLTCEQNVGSFLLKLKMQF